MGQFSIVCATPRSIIIVSAPCSFQSGNTDGDGGDESSPIVGAHFINPPTTYTPTYKRLYRYECKHVSALHVHVCVIVHEYLHAYIY